MKSKVIQI